MHRIWHGERRCWRSTHGLDVVHTAPGNRILDMLVVTDVLSAGFAEERLQCGRSLNQRFFRFHFHVTTGHAPALRVSRILSHART